LVPAGPVSCFGADGDFTTHRQPSHPTPNPTILSHTLKPSPRSIFRLKFVSVFEDAGWIGGRGDFYVAPGVVYGEGGAGEF